MMIRRTFLLVAAVLAVVGLAAAPAGADGTTQISGIGYAAAHGDGGTCEDPEGDGSSYAVLLTGDLEGCLYGFDAVVKGPGPSGVLKERANEIFVDGTGTFQMTENFHARIGKFGFCKHPIVKGSGTGDYEGVTGRLDFRDDLVEMNFPYTGHLKLG